MLKLTGRTTFQIEALKNEGFTIERQTASTCEVHGYDTYADLYEAVQLARQASLSQEEGSHGAWLGKNIDPQAVKRERKGHFTALGSVLRYLKEKSNEAVTVKAVSPDETAKAIEKARKAQERKEAKKAKAKAEGNPCQCLCGGTTGGGRFLPGHDAKRKGYLVKTAVAGEGSEDPNELALGMNAYAELEERGWLKFYDKALEIARRPKVEPRVKRQEREQDDEERARQKIARLNLLKEAGEVLRGLGRYGKSAGELRVPVSVENAQAIVDGRFDYDKWDELGLRETQEWGDFIEEVEV